MRARRGFAQATAWLALIGITAGVAALNIAFALANGFRDELRDKILQGTAHLTVTRADGAYMNDVRDVIARVKAQTGVRRANATTYEGALVNSTNANSYAVLRGVETTDAAGELRAQLLRMTTAGTSDPLFACGEKVVMDAREASVAPALVGAELAARVSLNVGDTIEAITPGNVRSAASGDFSDFAPRTRRLRVVGIFRTGLYEYDATWIYVPLAVAGDLAGVANTTTTGNNDQRGNDAAASFVSVDVADADRVEETERGLRTRLGAEFVTVNWKEANRPLFAALAVERRIVSLVIWLIIIIAALNVTTTLVLVVRERRAEIATMVALGARRKSVLLIFLLEGATLGAVGAFVGSALGLFICDIANRFQLVQLPADVYSLQFVPLHPRAWEVLAAWLIAFAISLLATIYPALAAARLHPAAELRGE